MKIIKAFILFSSIALLSCDDRFEFLADVNSAPVISIFRSGIATDDNTLLKDGVKTSLKYNNLPYDFSIAASDRETSLTRASYRFISGNGILKQGLTVLDGQVILTAGEALVRFEPSDVGKVIIEFTVEDDFKKRSIARAEFDVFLNLKPIAKLSAVFDGTKGPYHYRIDASESIDQDVQQGGEIQAYHFIFNETEHVTSRHPVVMHNFEDAGPGRRNVKLEVVDNDGDRSSMVPLVVQ